jgi:hypothetical protein
VVVRAHDELEHWVWFERLERKWSIGKYGGGRWRYRHPRSHQEQFYAEAAEYFGKQMSQETGIPLQECTDRMRRI